MNDVALKQLTDGGIVGVLIVLALWWTRVGHPRLMVTLDRYAEAAHVQRREHLAAQASLQAAHLAALAEQRRDHLDTLRVFREHGSQDAQECRAERAALFKAFREEREADRQARQEQAAEFTALMADVYGFKRGARDGEAGSAS